MFDFLLRPTAGFVGAQGEALTYVAEAIGEFGVSLYKIEMRILRHLGEI